MSDAMLFNPVHLEKTFPAVIRGRKVLVPLKIDLTHGGARHVDSFCWDIFGSTKMSPYEFAARTCADLNLHPAFQTKIALQIAEQVESFESIIALIKMTLRNDLLPNIHKIREKININISIRHGTIDYSDKFIWDPMCSAITPEKFARTTVADLGLPADMEPVIAFKIRETLFRNMISWLDDPNLVETVPTISAEEALSKVSEIKISLVSATQAVDMATNLWKRAKPSSVDDHAYTPMPYMSLDKDSNASIWK